MRRARARTGDSATTPVCEGPAATLWAWEWRWRRRPACSCVPPLRSARHETVHDDLAVQWEYLLVRVVTLSRAAVASREQNEGGALGTDAPQCASAYVSPDADGTPGILLVHLL